MQYSDYSSLVYSGMYAGKDGVEMTDQKRLAKLYGCGLPFPIIYNAPNNEALYWFRKIRSLGIEIEVSEFNEWWQHLND